MNIENVIRQEYNIDLSDNLYISARFYKKESKSSFCSYFVHRTRCIVAEFNHDANPHNVNFVREIWQGDNNGKGDFAPIIRKWTGRNITWKFERGF